MSSNYFAPDFDPWVSNIRGLGTALAQVPAMRARAAAQQQLTAFRQAEVAKAAADTREAGARTSLLGSTKQKTDAETAEVGARTALLGSTKQKTDAQTTDLVDQTASGNRLSVALKKVMTNPNDTDAAGDAISEFGHYFKKNPAEAAKGMGDLLSHMMAMRGDTNFAQQGSLQGNAASIANNQANNTRVMQTPMVVPDNSVAIDKTTGQPVATSPQKLSTGQRLFTPGADNVTLDTQPVVQGAPTPPKTPLSSAIRLRAYAQAVAEDAKNGTTNAPNVLKQLDAVIGAPDETNAPPPTSAPAPYIQVTPGPVATPTQVVQPGAAPPTPAIPQTHISYLLAHPEAAADFDAKYGPGTAAAIIKQSTKP